MEKSRVLARGGRTAQKRKIKVGGGADAPEVVAVANSGILPAELFFLHVTGPWNKISPHATTDSRGGCPSPSNLPVPDDGALDYLVQRGRMTGNAVGAMVAGRTFGLFLLGFSASAGWTLGWTAMGF